MLAAIDVGSNTLRMLIGRVAAGRVQPISYHRRTTRLGGGFKPGKGLAPESMERTLSALTSFSATLAEVSVKSVRVVGTAALRRAENRQNFISQIKSKTGLTLEIISGIEEARLSAAGVLAVIDPLPPISLIVDIGGGSSEFVLCQGQQVLFQQSYPLGVVRLCEESNGSEWRQLEIQQTLDRLWAELAGQGLSDLLPACQLIGTAGTVTTLAAMQMQMVDYDWRRINNQLLSADWLQVTRAELLPMPISQRERFPGLESGRADLIIPGLEILLALCQRLGCDQLKVADSGLLEGLLLDLAQCY